MARWVYYWNSSWEKHKKRKNNAYIFIMRSYIVPQSTSSTDFWEGKRGGLIVEGKDAFWDLKFNSTCLTSKNSRFFRPNKGVMSRVVLSFLSLARSFPFAIREASFQYSLYIASGLVSLVISYRIAPVGSPERIAGMCYKQVEGNATVLNYWRPRPRERRTSRQIGFYCNFSTNSRERRCFWLYTCFASIDGKGADTQICDDCLNPLTHAILDLGIVLRHFVEPIIIWLREIGARES